MKFGLFVIISLIFLALGLSENKKRVDKHLSLFYVVIVSFLFGLRTDTPDTAEYVAYFKQLEGGNWLSLGYFYFEPGFQVLSHIIKLVFGNNDFAFLSFWSLFMGVLVYIATQRIINCISLSTITIKKNNIGCPILVSLILFYAYYGCFYGCITIRAGVALGFNLLILSILMQKKKAYLLCLGLLVISFLFHTSSLFICVTSISFVLLPKLKINNYLIILFITFSIFFSRINLFFIKILSVGLDFFMNELSTVTRMGEYSTALNNIDYGFSVKYIFQLICGFMFISVKFNNEVYYKFLNIYMLGLFMGALLAPINMAYRVLDYFYVVTYILLFGYFSSVKLQLYHLPMLVGIIIFQIILVYRVCYA